MTDLAAQNRRNRNRGKSWERDIMNGGRAAGIDTERTRDTGAKDEGDLVMRLDGHYHVIEAKNAKLAPTQFLNEAELEAKHFAEHRGLSPDLVHPVVMVKRRGKNFLGGLVLMTVEEYIRLLKGLST